MTLTFDPLVPWTWILGAAVALLLAELVPLWTRGRGLVTRSRAAAISLVGAVAVLVAVAALARPNLSSESRRGVRATILVDASRSMATRDAARGGSRYEAALEAAHELERALPLAHVLVEAFPSSASVTLPTLPEGRSTAIGDALAGALARAPGGSEPLAAIVVVSDGAQTSGRDPVSAAREAAAAGVRVFTVATGTKETKASPRLGRAWVVAPERAPAGSTATVRARVELEGLEGTAVDLELSQDGKVVGRTTVEGSGPRVTREAAFEVALGDEGIRALSLRAVAGARVSCGHARVHVLPGRVAVVLVDSPARWEHRYLRRALEDAPRIALARVDLWGAAGAGLDASTATLAAIDSADVIVLGDLPPRALGLEVGRGIARAVDEGKGLLVLAGRRGFDEARRLELGPLLPVSVSEDAVPLAESARPTATDAGRDLLSAGLGLAPAELASALDRLPALPSYVPLPPALRGSTVLLEAPSRRPLAVLGRHGLGRTAVLASDTTWRWAFAPRESPDAPGEHDRGPSPARIHAALWRELALALAPRDAGLRPPLELTLAARRAEPGEALAVQVELRGAAAGATALELTLEDPATRRPVARSRVERARTEAATGRAVYEIPRTVEGTDAVVRAVALDARGEELSRDERVIEIARPELEEQPGVPADEALLARIADAGGGAGFACEDVARGTATNAVASALEAARPVERRSGPVATGPRYALLLALLLGATWGLRRGGGLA